MFLLLLGPVCVLILFIQGKFYGIMKHQASMYTAQYIEKISYDIELNLSELDKMAVALQKDAAVEQALLGGDIQPAELQMERILSENSLAQRNGSAILLLNRGQRVVASTYQEWTGLLRTLGPEWMNKIISSDGGRVLISGYSITKGAKLSSTKVICLARGVFREETLLGYLMIEIPIRTITQICQGVSLGNQGFVALVDGDNYVIFSTQADAIGGKFMDLDYVRASAPYREATIRGKRMIVVEVPATISGIRVIGAIPAEEIEQPLIAMRSGVILAIGAISLAVLLAVSLLTQRISQPIVEMKNAMARVEKGDFAVHVSQTRSDEIGDLQKGFNHMVEQVDALIAREYDTALRQREAQLSEMMAIINPHFIYNTLEAISMTAYLNDDEEVVEMIGHLGGMFRSMAGNPATGRVPLRQEIRTVESYLTLINVRQDGKILVSWNVDQSLLDGQTLKFTIQPVVENSVIHGFEGRTEGHIWIDIHRDANGDVAIVVQDDGQGMTVDALTRLKHILSHEENPPKNRLLALKNVHDRLRLVFGPHYGVDVRQRSEGGLCITLLIPFIPPSDSEEAPS